MKPDSEEFQAASRKSAELVGELMHALLKEEGQTQRTVLTGMTCAVAAAALALRPDDMTPSEAAAAILMTLTGYLHQMVDSADDIRMDARRKFQ